MDNFNNKEKEIFKASIKYTKNEYLKLNKFHAYVLPRYLYIAIYALMFFIFTFGLYFSMNKWFSVAIIVFIVLITIYFISSPYLVLTNNLKKKKIKLGLKVDFTFYSNKMKIELPEDNIVEIKSYIELFKAYETKTNFYLYINKNSAYIIPKKKITGKINKVREILKYNLGKKYIRLI